MLTSLDLLARVIAPRAAAFRSFDTLATDDGGTRTGSRPIRLRSAITNAWLICSNLASSRSRADQRFTVCQRGKFSTQTAMRSRFAGRRRLRSRSHARPLAPSSRRTGLGQKPGNQSPLRVVQIRLGSLRHAHILRAGGWGPNACLRDVYKLPESHEPKPLSPFRNDLSVRGRITCRETGIRGLVNLIPFGWITAH